MAAGTSSSTDSSETDLRVGFLGPHGTFTEQAILSQPDLAVAEHVLMRSMREVLEATATGHIDLGFCAIENSIEGTVNVTLDTLAFDTELWIQREVVIPVHMHLHGRPGSSLDQIKRVISFPHATGQCRGWLAEHLPHAEEVAANSTAEAVQDLAESDDCSLAAIGTQLAGELYGLEPLAADIADHKGNETRFVTVARDVIPAETGHDKTSIVIFQRDDRPGGLLSILQEFAARAINLTKLESRPTKQALGDYCFIIDMEGHIADELVADCLKNIQAKQADVRFLGSYPVTGTGSDDTRRDTNEAWDAAVAWIEELRSHQL